MEENEKWNWVFITTPVVDGELLHTLYLPGSCNTFDLNKENTLLAVAHQYGVWIWNFSTLDKIMEIEVEYISDVRFNELGARLIVGHYDGQVSKIDLYWNSKKIHAQMWSDK